MNEHAANDEFDDELLSAYLDGELTSDEQALVEGRLRADPRAKQLLEEMRAMSTAIKSLPTEKLPRDLRAGVWAGVEETPVAGRVTPVASMHDSRWEGFRRGLVWSAITIAAALLLMFMQPEQVNEGEVADAKRQDESEELVREEMKERAVRGLEDVPGIRAPNGRDAAATGRGGLDSPPPPSAATVELYADKESTPSAPVEGAPAGHSEMKDEDAAAPLADATLESLAETGDKSLAQAPEPSAAAALAPMAAGAEDGESTRRLTPQESRLFGKVEEAQDRLASSIEQELSMKLAGRGDETPVVEVALAAPQASARFDELLVENGIALQAEPAPPAQRDAAAVATAAPANEVAVDESVLVVASPDQIEKLIADCRAEGELFQQVAETTEREKTPSLADETRARLRSEATNGAAAPNDFREQAAGPKTDAEPATDAPADASPADVKKFAAGWGGARQQSGMAWRWRMAAGEDATSFAKRLNQDDAQYGYARRFALLREENASAPPPGKAEEPAAADDRSAETQIAQLDAAGGDAPGDDAAMVRVLFVLRPAPESAAADAAKPAPAK